MHTRSSNPRPTYSRSFVHTCCFQHTYPHVPLNLALILAWTYGAVARALGSLVNVALTNIKLAAIHPRKQETFVYRPKGQ